MAQKPSQPRLGPSGQALWDAVHEVLILDGPAEEVMLRELCRCADELDVLHGLVAADGAMLDSSQGSRVHPALVELRQVRLTFARLASAMGLPQGITDKRQNPHGVRGVYSVKVAGL